MIHYEVPYGHKSITFRLPPGFHGQLLETNPMPSLPAPGEAIDEALSNPLGSPRISELAEPGMNVVVVVTDATRECPDDLLVPPILDELNTAGVPDEDITVMVGIGMHRPATDSEMCEKLGAGVVSRVKVVNPTPGDPSSLIDLGPVAHGVPCRVNRGVFEADLVIATGVVEPHQYAGYSGGRKTVAIGCSSAETIRYSHGPAMLDHPKVRLAQIEGNPFHEAIAEIAKRVGLSFVLNVVADEEHRLVAVAAGWPDAVLEELVRVASPMYTVQIDGQFDAAIAGVGHPKDSNFYQASRAASYLQFAPEPVVRPGGVIIVPARAEEGVGQGAGEQAYLDAMRQAASPAEIIAKARAGGYQAGGQRAYVMAQVLAGCIVVMVGSEHPEIAEQLKFRHAASMDEALKMASRLVGNSARVAVIPHALMTLPVVREKSPALA